MGASQPRDSRVLEATGAIRTELAVELSRRQFVRNVGIAGLGATILGALPVAERLARPPTAWAAQPDLLQATQQAFFDTMIPGRVVAKTQSGADIHPQAILGVDPEPGAVEADALVLAEDVRLGFNVLAPVFLADLEVRSLAQGGQFLDLDWDAREAVCVQGLAFSNTERVIWESAAAVAFTAFCAAATVVNATRETAIGYRVMGHPGTAPHGYKNFSYRRRLNRGRTRKGYLS